MRSIFSICFLVILLPTFAFSEPVVIKIGATIPLSGDLAYVGEDIVKGLQLAKKDFDSEDFKLEIVTEDDGFTGKNAATTGMKLLNVDKVDVIISLWDMAEIIAPLAEKKKIPHFSIRWNPSVAEQHHYTVTIESTYKSWIESLLKLLQAENTKTISIIHEEAVGWNLGQEYLTKLLKSTDIKVVSDTTYLRTETDYRSVVMKAVKSKPDYIILLTNPPFSEGFIKIIKQVSPQQKYTGYFEIVKDLSLIEGMPSVAQLEPAPWFIEKFEKEYHSSIAARAPQTYDIAAIVHAAHEGKGKKLIGDEIIKFVENLKDFKGASGLLNSKGSRTVEMDCVWKVVKGGKLEIYRPAN